MRLSKFSKRKCDNDRKTYQSTIISKSSGTSPRSLWSTCWPSSNTTSSSGSSPTQLTLTPGAAMPTTTSTSTSTLTSSTSSPTLSASTTQPVPTGKVLMTSLMGTWSTAPIDTQGSLTPSTSSSTHHSAPPSHTLELSASGTPVVSHTPLVVSLGAAGNLSNDTRTAIAGGVIGGIALLFTIVLILVFRRPLARRLRDFQNRHTAPSAEFLNHSSHLCSNPPGGTSPSPGPLLPHRRGPPDFVVNAKLKWNADAPVKGDWPPSFSPGAYDDPLVEKISSAAGQRERYFRDHKSSTMDPATESMSETTFSQHANFSSNPYSKSLDYPVDSTEFLATSPISSGRSEDNSPLESLSIMHGDRKHKLRKSFWGEVVSNRDAAEGLN